MKWPFISAILIKCKLVCIALLFLFFSSRISCRQLCSMDTNDFCHAKKEKEGRVRALYAASQGSCSLCLRRGGWRGRGAPVIGLTSPNYGPRSLAGAPHPCCSSWQPLAKDNNLFCLWSGVWLFCGPFDISCVHGVTQLLLTNSNPIKGSVFWSLHNHWNMFIFNHQFLSYCLMAPCFGTQRNPVRSFQVLAFLAYNISNSVICSFITALTSRFWFCSFKLHTGGWGEFNHLDALTNFQLYFLDVLKLIWSLVMFIYFILHHLQGYSGTDVEISDLLILTCTLQHCSSSFEWFWCLSSQFWVIQFSFDMKRTDLSLYVLWTSFYFAFSILLSPSAMPGSLSAVWFEGK